MKFLWSYIRKYKKTLVATMALATVNQVFSLLDPQIFRLIIDKYVSRVGQISHDDFIRGVVLLLLGSVGLAFVSRVAKNFQDYYLNVIVQRVGTQMYSRSVEHSFSLPYAVFEDQRSGEFLQKLQKARQDSQVFITSGINVVFLSLIGIIFVLGYAFFINWLVGVVYLLMIPILGFTTFLISKRIKGAQVKIIKETAALAGSTTETIRNVELVKSLGLEKQEIKHLNDTNEQILQLELGKIKIIRKFSFLQGTTINALRSVLTFLMLWLIFRGSISLGEYFSLLFYSFFIFNPLGQFGDVIQQYQEASASLERLEGILAIKPEEKPASPVDVGRINSIKFHDVTFGYETSTTPAVENVNVEIKSGDTVAFVGPSGSGKTTMVKLIVGLYKPLKGGITFNDVDSSKLDFEKIRKKLGLVAQDTQLFAGTIKENLLFANPSATDEDCMKALKSAAANTLVERGDKGLDTKIGEGGLKISGGEKQRLAIARALLRQPELIIFDEATSSLDSITEESITHTIKNIETEHPNLITVMVAHRLSTILHADTIFVLERGKIVESGNHDELLKKQGLYFALWRQQIAVKEREPLMAN